MLHAIPTQNPSDKAAQCVVEERSIAQRIADVMIDKAGVGCHLGHLLDAGLTETEVNDHVNEARLLASQRFMRRDDSPTYTRDERVQQAANSIFQLMPETVTISLHLMARKFTKAELDDMLPDAIAQAADMFAGEGRPQ